MAKVDLERIKQELRKAQARADKQGIRWLRLREEENLIRILPPWSDEGLFAKESGYHYGVTPEQALACPRICKKEECPICNVAQELYKSRKPDDIQWARRIGVKMRYFANVLDRVARDGQVYVLGFGPMIYEQLLGTFADEDYGDITDIANGYDIKIFKTGEGLDTKYTVRPSKNPSKVLHWDKKKKLLVNLDELVATDLLPYKRLQALLDGTDSGEEELAEESEGDEEKVQKSRPKGPKAPAPSPKASSPEAEEGDMVEEETEVLPESADEEEEEAEPAPPKKANGRDLEVGEDAEDSDSEAEEEKDLQRALEHLKSLRKRKG